MKGKCAFVFIIILCCYSCGTSNDHSAKGVVSKGGLPFDPVAILNENNSILGSLVAFDFINETEFILATKSGKIVTYNINGERLQGFSRTGSGPYEYRSPSAIKVINGKIYVWCEQLLKLVVYDLEGKPIEEHSDFSRAIKDFVIRGDMLYFYMSGGGLDALIQKYDLKKRKVVGAYGKEENQDEVASVNACAGGLLLENESVYYMRSGALSIASINKDAETSKFIQDDEFEVEKLEDSELAELKNSGLSSLLEFVSNNSFVSGLYQVGSNYVIHAVVGSFEYESFFDLKTYDTSKRFDKYYVLNEDFELIETFNLPFSSNRNNCLFQSNGRSLFFISEIENDEQVDYQYQLNKVDLN